MPEKSKTLEEFTKELRTAVESQMTVNHFTGETDSLKQNNIPNKILGKLNAVDLLITDGFTLEQRTPNTDPRYYLDTYCNLYNRRKDKNSVLKPDDLLRESMTAFISSTEKRFGLLTSSNVKEMAETFSKKTEDSKKELSVKDKTSIIKKNLVYAKTFWEEVKDLDNLTSDQLKFAANLFKMCYNGNDSRNDSRMQIFRYTLAIWNGTYTVTNEELRRSMEGRANAIFNAYTECQKNKGDKELKINPLLVEKSFSARAINEFKKLIENHSNQDLILNRAAEYFHKNPDDSERLQEMLSKIERIKKMYGNSNEVSNFARNLTKMMVWHVSDENAKTGTLNNIDNFISAFNAFSKKANKQGNIKSFLEAANAGILSDILPRRESLERLGIFNGKQNLETMQTIAKRVAVVDKTRLSANDRVSETDRSALAKICRDFLNPNFDTDKVIKVESKKTKVYIQKESSSQNNQSSLQDSKVEYYSVRDDLGNHLHKNLTQEQLCQMYYVTEEDLANLSVSQATKIYTSNKETKASFAYIVPRYSSFKIDSKTTVSGPNVVVFPQRNGKVDRENTDNAIVMSREDFQYMYRPSSIFNAVKQAAEKDMKKQWNDSFESGIPFENVDPLVKQAKSGFGKLILLDDYNKNSDIMDGFHKGFGDNKPISEMYKAFNNAQNQEIKKALVEKAYTFASDSNADRNLDELGADLMGLSQRMITKGVNSSSISSVINSCNSFEEVHFLSEKAKASNLSGSKLLGELQNARADFLNSNIYCSVDKKHDLELTVFKDGGKSVDVIRTDPTTFSDARACCVDDSGKLNWNDFYKHIVSQSTSSVTHYESGSEGYKKVCGSLKNTTATINKDFKNIDALDEKIGYKAPQAPQKPKTNNQPHNQSNNQPTGYRRKY